MELTTNELTGGTSLPNETRGFIHKRIIGAVTGGVGALVTGGNPLAGAGRGFFSSRRRTTPAAAVKFSAQMQADIAAHRRHGHLTAGPGHVAAKASELVATRGAVFPSLSAPSAPRGCIIPGQRRDQFGNCSFFVGERLGPEDMPIGEAVMGQYGAALVPGGKVIDRRICIRGMVLGTDLLCYNKSQISNKERRWPRGRRPLLTGGEMRAISIASRASKRLTSTAQRMHEIGLLKKPITRGRSKKRA